MDNIVVHAPPTDPARDEVIRCVTAGIIDSVRIKEQSVCEIYRNITPMGCQEGTLMDPRLGSTGHNVVCPTCQKTHTECVGHFGHMFLAKPVYIAHYYYTIIKLLRCFCNQCSSILINKVNPNILREITSKNGEKRLCPNCGADQPKYEQDKEGILRIKAYYQSENKTILMNPEIVLAIFAGISDENFRLIGLDRQLTRPEQMILTIIPIPPITKTHDDDLTQQLTDCIRYNLQLRHKIAESTDTTSNLADYWQILQYHVAQYIETMISKLPKISQNQELQ